MRSFLVLFACAGFAALCEASSSVTPEFMRGLASYNYMKFDRCFRVKIQENNDDDGNSYFYNGAYRSQSVQFVAYSMCNDCNCNNPATSFVAALEDVLEDQLTYTQNYCNTCQATCNRRRKLEDAGGDEQGDYNAYNGNQNMNYQQTDVDCKTCSKACAPLNENYYDGFDETDYLQCQLAFEGDDGMAYYSMPACNDEGKLVIGLFYDEDCTVKKEDVSGYGLNFAYNTFLSMEDICMSCDDGICDNVEQTLECVDGRNQNYNVEDDMGACKAFKKVSKEWTYAKARHPTKFGLIILAVLLLFCCCSGSYTYYVRHKNYAEKEKSQALATADPKATDYAVMTY